MKLTSGTRPVLGHGFGVGEVRGLANQSSLKRMVLAFFWLGVGPARGAFSPPAHLQLMPTVGRLDQDVKAQ